MANQHASIYGAIVMNVVIFSVGAYPFIVTINDIFCYFGALFMGISVFNIFKLTRALFHYKKTGQYV